LLNHSIEHVHNVYCIPLYLSFFDAARANGYLCLAVLERGDAMPVLQEMDGVLYLGDNALHGAEPIPGFRAGASPGLQVCDPYFRSVEIDFLITLLRQACPVTRATMPGPWMQRRTSS
jgi:hypothetical protein